MHTYVVKIYIFPVIPESSLVPRNPSSPQEEIICHHRFVLLVLELHINEIIIEYIFFHIITFLSGLSAVLALLFKSLL